MYLPTETAKPLDHLAVHSVDRAIALVLREEELSYQALNIRVGQLAWWLTTHLGHGERIATWLPKTETACLMPLAAARAGLVHVPINPMLKRAQVQHILADSGARMLVSNLARINSLETADVPPECALWDERDARDVWIQGSDWAKPSHWPVEQLAAILYTSGSTGNPKGVMLSHANLWFGAVGVASYLKLVPHERTLCVLPFSFDYGQNQLLSTWAVGGRCVPLDYLMPRDVVKAIAKYEITTLAGVPPLWVQLIESEWPDDAAASLKRITNSGGAFTPHLVQSLRALLPDTDIYAMYGLTEAFRSTYLDPALVDGNPVSIGTAVPYAEIMVVNDQGDEAQIDEEGELVHAGPLVAQGYWQDAVRTAERFKPAPRFSKMGGTAVWSGDRVRRGADGLLYFVGRRDAMIKSSGHRISPSEIEDAAVATGHVIEAVALGVADARLGQAIHLVARAKGGATEDDIVARLTQALKTQLPGYMLPHSIEVRAQLPRTPNGKLDRVALQMEADKKAGLAERMPS